MRPLPFRHNSAKVCKLVPTDDQCKKQETTRKARNACAGTTVRQTLCVLPHVGGVGWESSYVRKSQKMGG